MPSGDGVEAPRVIVLHDALRPLVTAEQIERLVMAAAEAGIAVGAEPVKETIKRVAGGRVVETLSRDELALLIPPLAVRAGVLPALVSRLGRSSRARIMDYVAVARGQGITVRSVELTGPSLVVTSSEDLALAEALLSRTPGSVIG